jgi:hypothetical protein
MGVAHAPLAALLGCDSGAEGRPAAPSAAGCRREAADWQKDRAAVIAHADNAIFVLREQILRSDLDDARHGLSAGGED